MEAITTINAALSTETWLALNGCYLRWLAALLYVASFADRLGLFAGFTEVSMNQTAVTFPSAAIFGVLNACERDEEFISLTFQLI